MSELSRAKKSCEPCRRRKSRCNDQIPCQSCILRGTEAKCIGGPLQSSSTRPTPYVVTSPNRLRSEPQSEIDQVRASIAALEDKVKGLSGGLGTTADRVDSPEDRENWVKLSAALPPLETVEILLEFLNQECDWLYFRPQMISQWTRAVAHRAVSTPIAGSLCLSIAISALLLGPTRQMLYKPETRASLHVEFYQLATSFAGQMGSAVGLEGIQLLADLCSYAVYSGNLQSIMDYSLPMIMSAQDYGLMDESRPLWDHVDARGRNEMRELAEAVLTIQRWCTLSGHHLPKMPANLNNNFCRPAYRSAPLSAPLALGTGEETTFRILRLRGRAENHRANTYRALTFEITRFFDRVSPSRSDQYGGLFAEKARTTLDDLMAWKEQRVIGNGFVVSPVDGLDMEDLLVCQNLAQAVYLHHAYYCIIAILLRPWLSERKADPSMIEVQLQQACLDNAEAVKNTIPHIKALVASRRAPIILPWLASNLFYAAITFATPVIRAVTHTSAFEKDEAVRRLLSIPDTFAKQPWVDQVAPTLMPMDAQPVPIEVFSNVDVWRCATNMLTILDGMSVLNSSPFSSQAQSRLEDLIQQTGLRESEAIMNGEGLPELSSGAWSEPPTDAALFEQLLQMGPTVWEQLAAYPGPSDMQ